MSAGKMDFETAFNRLNEIVNGLEEGTASLEESLKLFEEGMKLIDFSRKELVEAEERVKTLVQTNSGFEESPGVKE